MLVKDAKKKTCPFTLENYRGSVLGGLCEADECMAWHYNTKIEGTKEPNPVSGYCARLMVVRNR